MEPDLSTFFGKPEFPSIRVPEDPPKDFKERQVGGSHYKRAIQPWDIISEWEMNFWEGNIQKYLLRHKHKNRREDLEKARHYLDYLIENYDELF